jgi:hypothetical protein
MGTHKKIEARLSKRFEPLSWKPRYDQMIYRHCLGISNNQIADELKVTAQHVSNVLNCTQGQARIRLMQLHLTTKMESNLGTRLVAVAEKAVSRIESVMHDDNLFEKSPFAVVDRGMAVLKGIGRMGASGEVGVPSNIAGGPSTIINNNTRIDKAVILSEEAAKNLSDAIKLSDEVNEIHYKRPFSLLNSETGQVTEVKEKAS